MPKCRLLAAFQVLTATVVNLKLIRWVEEPLVNKLLVSFQFSAVTTSACDVVSSRHHFVCTLAHMSLRSIRPFLRYKSDC